MSKAFDRDNMAAQHTAALAENARGMCLKRGTRIGTDLATESYYYVVDGVVWCVGARRGAVNNGNYGEFMDAVRAGKIPRFKPEGV